MFSLNKDYTRQHTNEYKNTSRCIAPRGRSNWLSTFIGNTRSYPRFDAFLDLRNRILYAGDAFQTAGDIAVAGQYLSSSGNMEQADFGGECSYINNGWVMVRCGQCITRHFRKNLVIKSGGNFGC